MLNLLIFALLFFLLIFSTFLVVPLPFVAFFLNNSPNEITTVFSSNILSFGYFNSNLQIPIIIFSALLLNPRLSFVFITTYLAIGFSGYPIFYSGGGLEYLNQDSIGYLFAFLPAVMLISYFAWKDRNFDKYLFNIKFIFFIALSGLLLIHLIGYLTTFYVLKDTISYSSLLQTFFFIPILSHVLLTAVICILATNLNKIKFFALAKYKLIVDYIIKAPLKKKTPLKK